MHLTAVYNHKLINGMVSVLNGYDQHKVELARKEQYMRTITIFVIRLECMSALHNVRLMTNMPLPLFTIK